MLKKSIIHMLAVLAIGGAALAQSPPQNPPLSPSPMKRTVIAKVAAVPNSNYEVTTAMVEIAPGFKAPRHLHPGIVDAYVIEGEFWLAIDGQPEKTFTASQSLEVPDHAIHAEGAVGDKPSKLFAIYVLEKGQPMVVPVK
jgi:quercetin dioxygenase-like cupin family protein